MKKGQSAANRIEQLEAIIKGTAAFHDYPAQLRNDLEARLTIFICEEIGRRLDANPEAIKLLRKSLPEIEANIVTRLEGIEKRLIEMCEKTKTHCTRDIWRIEEKLDRRFTKLKRNLVGTK